MIRDQRILTRLENTDSQRALGNGLNCTWLNNARTNSAVQSPAPVNPAWSDSSSDRLGYDGAGRNITKRYLPGISGGSYTSTTPVVGFTNCFDRAKRNCR